MALEGLYAQLGAAPGQMVEGLQRNKLINANILSQQGQDQRAQQKFDLEQQAAQQQAAQQQQYNALLAEYLGPEQGAMAAGMQQPAQQAPQNALLSQLYQMDPQRTQQLVQFQQQQQQAAQAQQKQEAEQVVRSAQFVLESQAPKQLMQVAFPQLVDALTEQGVDFKSMDDDQVRELANRTIAQYSPIAGMGPAGGDTRVQSTQILEDGEIAVVRSDGTLQRTGEYARNPMQIAEIEGGMALVDRLSGRTRQLSDAQGEIAASASRKEAEGRAAATGTAEATRWAGQISDGLAAADALAITRRGLDLLKDTSTGGVNALALWASNRLGITGADQGELSANLGKAVLSQLRATFGAQFTEREGARLAEIEAGFGKSTAANRRLLEQAAQIMDRTARRGIQAAEKAGDEFAAKEIRDALDFRLDYSDDKAQPSRGAPKRVTSDAEYNALPSGTEFIAPDGSKRVKP